MQATSQGSGKHILLIDQDPVLLKIFDLAFSEHDVTAHCASSAEQAIEICKAHHLRIVLADVDFLGEAGLQLLASIKAMQPHVCICLMSASMPPYTDDDLKRLGVAKCFSKPMELSKLVGALKQLPE
jgi:DNA-binding NtrC family response regulator